MPLFHPCLNKYANNGLIRKLFSLYPYQFPRSAMAELRDAHLFIVESGAGLMLIPRLAKYCKSANFLYSVSDRLQMLDAHPAILRGESDALPYLNAIRVPAAVMKNDFGSGFPVFHINPGLHKSLFDHASVSPYNNPRNVVSIGDMLFDARSIEIMAENFPEWSFHLFGKGAKLTKKLPNVIEYGECSFLELVPYIQHADIGLAPYKDVPNADYLSQSSLKMIQYTYCRLPIVAPNFAATGRSHVLSYEEGDRQSIIDAFERAIIYDRDAIDHSQVLSWEEMLDCMLGLIKYG
jgi:2-beta-glucuronyltransferase